MNWSITKPKTDPRLIIHLEQGHIAYSPDWRRYPGIHRTRYGASVAPGPPVEVDLAASIGGLPLDTDTTWHAHFAYQKTRVIFILDTPPTIHTPPAAVISSPCGETLAPTEDPWSDMDYLKNPERKRRSPKWVAAHPGEPTTYIVEPQFRISHHPIQLDEL